MKTEFPEFMNIKQIAVTFGISPSTATRYSAEPDFPEPFYFSPGKKVWLKKEVLDWFMSRRGRRAA
jgi:predicted DNA-binding transcriptional regulator AlpA